MTPLQVRILVVLGAVAAALALVFLVMLTVLKNYCVLGSNSCTLITYRQRDAELLVETQNSGVFWFDGAYVYDYSDTVPLATCRKGVAGVLPGVMDPQLTPESVKIEDGCLRFKDGVCQENSLVTTALKFSGSQENADDFTPCFTLDATTMTLVPDQVRCALKVSLVAERFNASPAKSVRVRRTTDRTLNVYEIFAMLERRNIFKRPEKL